MDNKRTYKIAELDAVSKLLGDCKNDKDLKNPSSMISIIRLVKSIQKIGQSHADEQKELLEKFDVPRKTTDNGEFFDWSEMSQDVQDKIKKAVFELGNTEYTVDGFNKIDEEDFIIYTKGLEVKAISFLWDYLVKL